MAVTACPTGLAHTYLAAEALQKAAQERGVSLKVETNGAAGVNNPLSTEDIAGADCIIVATDRTVSTARFVGKRVVSVSTREAIRDPGAVLDRAAESSVPVYRGGDGFRSNDWKELGREAYRHLMSGITHMLPFVVAGGVLIALALFLAQLGVPASFTDMMDTVGRAAFVLVYPVLAAFIAYSISDLRPSCQDFWADTWHSWALLWVVRITGSPVGSGAHWWPVLRPACWFGCSTGSAVACPAPWNRYAPAC